ncbi:Molybdopterin-synthase adenylyltransferase [Pseudidiomarina piscicola]|uniref:Molybdopterin-synthase adenylyltransferase n=1 Tax=Pseudidiomarina piscicola TaxID=2614830 RepID=A0A6S6WNH9_9GAMM|nr:molybdopterin-synthase adenylyltransferase MoeB [Pseudidiomarina piscicola]CAB0151472.1 Molybdopterin-synthase adenylyltransferase [Pseudidiomarina piscicola]VZT40951.1 Molybdopterin-synthase adenylyltransferase [Pseudomonas aeruginosa]
MTLPELTREQLLRYSRHVMLPNFDLEGQERLLASRVLVIGMGGLGCAVAPYLVGSGIGQLTLVDDDVVDKHNLPRQVVYRPEDIGISKVQAAKQRLQSLNTDCTIEVLAERVDAATLSQLVQQHDCVIDCCDNLTTRNAINAACVEAQTPLVSGAAIRYEGQLSVFLNQQQGPCYRCLSLLFGEQQLSCMESGILAPVVGVVGTMQAVETLKLLAQVGAPIAGRVLLYDGLHGDWQNFKLSRHPQCQVCAA